MGLVRRPLVEKMLLASYLYLLRAIRQRCFELWLKCLQTGCAVVNLPSLVRANPGRVVEGMAAGRPVISWEIPDRPQNNALFQDGKEILLYPEDSPAVLAEHIKRIKGDRGFADQIAENARRKIGRIHTIEVRVRQILDWITTGDEPSFS